MVELADSWNVGAVRAPQVFAALPHRTGMTPHAVEAHARDCGQRLAFNRTAWRVAAERQMPQALVTVNPDLFAEYVVPVHNLAAVFDVIVMSFAEKTADKPELCLTALDRLGFNGGRSQVLLIDDRVDLVQAWRDAGGAGYWFQSDGRFGQDLWALMGETGAT